MLKDLILKNRSYRRFYEDHEVSRQTLIELIDLARLSPSAANRQPLKYIISNIKEKNHLIFRCLSWAGYLTDWLGPEKGERPSAYIMILCDKEVSKDYYCDNGIAAQSIMLGAAEMGLGGCILAAVDRPTLMEALTIPDQYDILLVLALGRPKEEVILETVQDNNIKYWRDKEGRHHVPKRSIKELILDI